MRIPLSGLLGGADSKGPGAGGGKAPAVTTCIGGSSIELFGGLVARKGCILRERMDHRWFLRHIKEEQEIFNTEREVVGLKAVRGQVRYR